MDSWVVPPGLSRLGTELSYPLFSERAFSVWWVFWGILADQGEIWQNRASGKKPGYYKQGVKLLGGALRSGKILASTQENGSF